MKCTLGWTLVGPVNRPGGSDGPKASHINFVHTDNVALHGLMQKKCMKVDKDDGIGLGAFLEDRRALRIMEKLVVKVDDHYQIALPWKSESAKLPNNRTVAEKRLGYLRNRLIRDPELHRKYRNKTKEYFKNGHARKIP